MTDHHDDIITVYKKHCAHLKRHLQYFEDHTCNSGEQQGTKRLVFEIYVKEISDVLLSFERTLVRWKKVKDEFKNDNKLLQIELRELNLNLNAKTRCIDNLKESISSLYAQSEYLWQYKKKLSRSLEIVRNASQLQISDQCFKNQLYMCHIEKNKLNWQLVESRETSECQLKSIRALNNVIKEAKQSYLDNKLITSTENKKIQGKRKLVECTCNNQTHTSFCCSRENDEKLRSIELNETVEQNTSLKQTMQELEDNIYQNLKVNAELEAKCLVFQKSVDQNNTMIQAFENLKKNLCEKLILSAENGKNKNSKILKLIKDIDTLKMEALEQRHEKEKVEHMAFKINEKFIKMKKIQENLKAVLKVREEVILSLRTEKEKLLADNKMYRSLQFDDMKKNRKLSETVGNLELQNQSLAAVHYEELCSYVTKLNMMENQIRDIQSRLNEKEQKLILMKEENVELKNIISILNSEIQNKNALISSLQEKVTQVEEGYREEINSVKEDYIEKEKEDIDNLRIILKIRKMLNPFVEMNTDCSHASKQITDHLKNIGTTTMHMKDKIRKFKTKSTTFINEMHDRIEVLEEKCRRISQICSKNSELLTKASDTKLSEVLKEMKNLKTLAEVKEQEKNEQRKRFEKYNRLLLGQIRRYKKSLLKSEEHNGYLWNFYNTVIAEFKSTLMQWPLREDQLGNFNSSAHKENSETTLSTDELSIAHNTEMNYSQASLLNDHSIGECNRCRFLLKEVKIEWNVYDEKFQENNNIIKRWNESFLSHRKINDLSRKQKLKNDIIDETDLPIQTNQHKCEPCTCPNGSQYSTKKNINQFQSEIDILNSRLQQNIMDMDQLKKEKLNLQKCLQQREELLGKILIAFKLKIQSAVHEANDKFFLQRLCSDLRSALKMYTAQNKVLRDLIENRYARMSTVANGQQELLARKTNNCNEKYITALLEQNVGNCDIRDSFADIQSHLKSMKQEIFLLQSFIVRR